VHRHVWKHVREDPAGGPTRQRQVPGVTASPWADSRAAGHSVFLLAGETMIDVGNESVM
jgi:hypothetical protein